MTMPVRRPTTSPGGRARREVRSLGPDGAGGVAWRQRAGAVEVVLVRHRETGRWELPKGKAEPGEDSWSTARRELSEETGLACHFDAGLGRVDFLDRGGWRSVRYWLTEPLLADAEARPLPGTEIAEARWFRLTAGAPVPCQPYDALVLVSLATALVRRGIRLPVPPVPGGPGWRLVPWSDGGAGWPAAVSASGSVVARLWAPALTGPAWHAGGSNEAGPSSTAAPPAAGGPDATPGRGADEEVRR